MGTLRKSPTIIAAQAGLTCSGCHKVFDGTYAQAKNKLAKNNVYCSKKCRLEAVKKSSFYLTPIGSRAHGQ